SEEIIKNLDSTQNGTEVNLINYNQLGSKGGFDQIKFSTFDPKTPTVDKPADSCIAQPVVKDRTFSVLITNNNNCGENIGSKKKLSGGAIAGIVIGCVVATALCVGFFHYRERIRLNFKLSKKKLTQTFKLKKVRP
ncbi:hypothetical protein CYY_009653, partial [Polysphondylium violaceum]